MKKIIVAGAMTLMMMTALVTGCGKTKQQAASLEGNCEEILNRVYETADLDSGLREAMQYYETIAIDESSEEYILGTTDVDYTDSVYSAPMMSSVAYQCVILRLDANGDVEAAKQQLLDNADPRKWICGEAESVVVEKVGDVVLYVMADTKTADAIKSAFLALNE